MDIQYTTNEELAAIQFQSRKRHIIKALPLDVYPMKYSLIPSSQRNSVKDAGDLPAISGYTYALTPLRPGGWIFLHNKTINNWYEYKVLDSGQLHKCNWKTLEKDVRPGNDITLNSIKMEYGHNYEIYFSETQLSWKQYKELYDSESKRKEKMVLVSPALFRSKGTQKHVFTQPQMYSCYDSTNIFKYDTFKEDLVKQKDVCYIALQDPLFFADQLRMTLSLAYLKMEAILQSIKLGISTDKVYNALVYKKDITKLQTDGIRKELEALFRVNSTLYQIGYATKKNKDKFGKHLDQDRIEKCIASDLRKDQRKTIAWAKKKLVDYLKTDYYQNGLDQYLDNIPERILFARTRLALHVEPLSIDTDAKDKLLNVDTKGESFNAVDKNALSFLEDILNAKNKIGKLFEKKCPIKEKVLLAKGPQQTTGDTNPFDTVPVSEFIVQSLDKVLNQFYRLIERSERYLPILIRRLNTVQIVDASNTVLIAGFFEQVNIGDYIPTHYKKATKMDKYRVLNAPAIKKVTFIARESDIIPVTQIGFTQTVEKAFITDEKPLWKLLNKLSNSKSWNYFVAGLSFVNLVVSVSDMAKALKSKNDYSQIKAGLGLLGAMTDVWSSVHSVQHVHKLIAGASDDVLKAIGFKITRINAVGAFIGAAVSVYDAGINFYEKDYDAGIAYACSAVLGVLLGIALWNSWNPGVIIFLGLAGIAALIMALILEDPPFERLIKNCPMRQGEFLIWFDKDLIDFKGEPWKVALDHYTKRNDLSKMGFENWLDPVSNKLSYIRVYRDVEDMIYLFRLKSYKKEVFTKVGMIMNEVAVTTITFKCFLQVFDPGQSSLSFELLYYLKGIEKDANYYTISPRGDVKYTVNKDKRIIATITYDIPETYYKHPDTFYSQILLLTRVNYNKKLSYPASENNTPRYMGVLNSGHEAKENLSALDTETPNIYAALDQMNLWGDRIRIGTKAELLKADTWKKR